MESEEVLKRDGANVKKSPVFSSERCMVIIHHSYLMQMHKHTLFWMSSGQPQHFVVD